MPPARAAACKADLTAYFGKVTAYKHGKDFVWLRIATDYGTVEEVRAPTNNFLYQGRAWTTVDWQRVETRPGVLRPDTRATAWVCSDPKTPPLIDWNGAAE